MKKINKSNVNLRFNGDAPYWNTAQSRRDLAMCKAINVLAKTVDELVDKVNELEERSV